jgi:putative hydrolase of the HAD superfamily
MKAFNEIYYQRARTKAFDQYFDKAFYSCKIGFRKPDKICYSCVINNTKIVPEKSLFIDDSVANIEGAKRSKMQTILLAEGTKIEDLGL